MALYEYQCLTCGEIFEVSQSMKDEKFKEYMCKKTGKNEPCERLVTGGSGFILKGDGWTISPKTRGYKGKFGKHIRPAGSPVDAPANKREADREFQRWIDTGGLAGIKPTVNIYDRNNPSRPKTANEMIEKK